MDIRDLHDYCSSISTHESDVLYNINRETHLKTLKPQMLAGHLQGKLLQIISTMLKPKRVLEIGTFTAYSTICLAAGLQENGEIHTIELNSELEGIILNNLQRAEIINKVILHIGNAIDIIPQLKGEFDLIYLDADHGKAPAYFRLLKPLMSANGFLLVDNALWRGKVPFPELHDDVESKGIAAFNKLVSNDNDVDNFLLPFRDGIMFVKKK